MTAKLAIFVFALTVIQSLVAGVRARILSADGEVLAETIDGERVYPQGKTAAAVIGFVNQCFGKDGRRFGAGGLEAAFDERLSGVGPEVRNDGKGCDLVSTIRLRSQKMAEAALEKGVVSNSAAEGCCVAMDLASGAIVAMASFPNFDPARYQESDSIREMTSPAIAACREVGGVISPLVYARAFAYGIVLSQTAFDMDDASWINPRYFPREVIGGGRVTMTDAFTRGGRRAPAYLAVRLGDMGIADMISGFGLNRRTNVGLGGGVAGFSIYDTYSRDRPSEISLSRLGIGYGVAVTCVQLARAYSGIALDGKVIEPWVVDGGCFQGKLLPNYLVPQYAHTVALPKTTARTVRQLLVESTMEGRVADNAAVPGVSVAAMTGTAQITIQGKYEYSSEDFTSSCVGFFPAGEKDKPRYVLAVNVIKPRGRVSGNEVAAPIFSEIAYNLMYCEKSSEAQ